MMTYAMSMLTVTVNMIIHIPILVRAITAVTNMMHILQRPSAALSIAAAIALATATTAVPLLSLLTRPLRAAAVPMLSAIRLLTVAAAIPTLSAIRLLTVVLHSPFFDPASPEGQDISS